MGKQLQGSILLIITAILWGCSFVAQRTAANDIDPFTFNMGRNLLAFLSLLVVVSVIRARRNTRSRSLTGQSSSTPSSGAGMLLLGGLCCGLALCAGLETQQIGLITTSAGKSGFITALYIVEVPILGLIIGKRPRVLLWFCVALALAGLWLLTVQPGEAFGLQRGDIILLIGSVFFAVQILLVDYFVQYVDPIALATAQFGFATLGALIMMLLFGSPDWAIIKAAWFPIVYAGVLSSAVGFTFQIVAQKNVNPTLASLLMSLEAVFAVLGGWLLIHEHLAGRELLGCAIMFVAIILAQLPGRKANDNRS